MNPTVHLHSSLPEISAAGWNFVSGKAALTLSCDSQTGIATLRSAAESLQNWMDPLVALQWMADYITREPHARWVGYFSYDLGRWFESLPVLAADDLHLPLFFFSLHRSQGEGDEAEYPVGHSGSVTNTLSKAEYVDRVERAIAYINSGDVFQVNLSQRFTTALHQHPQQIWGNLLKNSPAAYGAYLNCGDHAIISNSPELFLRVDAARTVITRPIKGTRARKDGMDAELFNSEKDAAELNMIVDLERNDLGRVCEVGSVKVSQMRTIESHPTVHHGVATIEGRLRKDITLVDLLRATFPGGSITGAPKIRAMQIIEELEPVRRGIYCGAIGYLAGDGTMQFNVAIRTMIIRNGKVHIPVGGGIVADSSPAAEYEETLVKAQAMFAALNLKTPAS